MIEIIAGVWLTSLLLSIPITAWNIHTVLQSKRSPKYTVLNSNLAKIGLFWSLSGEQFMPLAKGNPDDDARKLLRTYLIIGCLGFLSLLGLIFLSIVTVSLHVLVKSRKADRVMKSELAINADLSPIEVQTMTKTLSV